MRSRTANVALIVALIAIFGGVALAALVAMQAPSLDPATGCLDEGVSAETVVLIDASDPIPAPLAPSVLRIVASAALRGGPETRLRLFLLGGDDAVDLIELDAFCNSLSAGSGGSVYRDRVHREFEARLKAGFETARNGQRTASPILEASERLKSRPGIVEVQHRNLILISDLLQNTARVSFYPGEPAYTRPGPGRVSRTKSEAPFWQTVSIVELQRPSVRHLQSKRLRQFWISWFDRDAGHVALTRL